MIIGIPKEIKNNENRVALTPAGAKELVKRGHTVYVQHTAGINSGFADDAYVAAGARILPAIEDVYGIAEMIVKVKEPIASEYPLVRKGQLVFTYFHFASDEALTLAMIKSGSICLAYETVENPDHTLPLLIPMSEVAGRMSVQEGARFLEKPQGGKGVLLGGVPGVKPGKVLVLGGGVVGHNAALMAAGLGADVTLALSVRDDAEKREDIVLFHAYDRTGITHNRFSDRRRINPRSQGPALDHPGYVEVIKTGQRIGRRSHRSRRLLRDLPSDYARQSGL